MYPDTTSRRGDFAKALKRDRDQTTDLLLSLLAIPSENPPGDTNRLAEAVRDLLQNIEGITTRVVKAVEPVANVIAVVHGTGPGRRLIFNGHLDTYGIGDPDAWAKNPYGQLEGDKIFGRGASDMKGGLAAQIFAACRLAELRQWWGGELVLVLCGDEETAGPNGTEYLLEHCEWARGDAMMCADAGSPHVIRFGEKGALWLTLAATGRAAHGAHVHLGVSAINRLVHALGVLQDVTRLPVRVDEAIIASIDAGAPISEEISGLGETQVLKQITLNVGTVSGGAATNLIADHAQASVDIRLPIGVDLEAAKKEVARCLGPLPGISYTIERQTPPNATPPDHEIVQNTLAVCGEVLHRKAVATMRVGASEAPLFRARDIPSVVCGLTPFNMGAPDEYVLTEELSALGEIYALAAFDYLTRTPPRI